MTNEIQQTPITDQKKLSFGARLKSVRETKGMERKDVATQLRLTEKKIAMMEYERYPADLPITFIRGYLRAYGRLLQIPEHDIKHAIELIKPKPVLHPKMRTNTLDIAMTSNSNYFMHFFTFLIILTMAGLVCMWWYTHSTIADSLGTGNQINIKLPEATNPALSMTATEHAPNNQKNMPSPSENNKVKTEAKIAINTPSIPKNTVTPTSENEFDINNSAFDID